MVLTGAFTPFRAYIIERGYKDVSNPGRPPMFEADEQTRPSSLEEYEAQISTPVMHTPELDPDSKD